MVFFFHNLKVEKQLLRVMVTKIFCHSYTVSCLCLHTAMLTTKRHHLQLHTYLLLVMKDNSAHWKFMQVYDAEAQGEKTGMIR